MKHLYRWFTEDIRLVELIEKSTLHAEEVDGKVGFEEQGQGHVNKSVRNCKLKWIKNEEVNIAVKKYFDEANLLSFGFDISHNPSLQYTIYYGNNSEGGNFYNWHADNTYVSETMGDRKLSMVVLLSDPHEYQGGKFQLSDNNVDEEGKIKYFEPPEFKKKGDIIIFPSFLNHRVTPVTSGVRKTFVSWAEGTKFR